MKPTFLPEIDGVNQQIFVVMSAGTMRELWATRLRSDFLRDMIASGGDPNTLTEEMKLEIEKTCIEQATFKFPDNANYLVRALEDDGVTPVAVFGDETTVITELENPVLCEEYTWDLTGLPFDDVVTLNYTNCSGSTVIIQDTPRNLGVIVNYCSLGNSGTSESGVISYVGIC